MSCLKPDKCPEHGSVKYCRQHFTGSAKYQIKSVKFNASDNLSSSMNIDKNIGFLIYGKKEFINIK